jgi:hypothetical protein
MSGGMFWNREYWEKRAEEAWKDLGKPPANSSPTNPTPNDLEYDAFRHAYTSAIWSKNLPDPLSKEGGDYIERTNRRNFTSERGMRDMRGDLINNSIGRDIGNGRDASGGKKSDQEIAREINDAIQRGELVLDKQTDPKRYQRIFPQIYKSRFLILEI